jgi:hypothetical protein
VFRACNTGFTPSVLPESQKVNPALWIVGANGTAIALPQLPTHTSPGPEVHEIVVSVTKPTLFKSVRKTLISSILFDRTLLRGHAWPQS